MKAALSVIGFCTLLVLGLSSTGKAASFESGNKLLEKCKGENNIDFGICVGYITAVSDEIAFEEKRYAVVNGKPIAMLRACVRNGVTAGQLRDIVVKYLTEHPEIRDYSAEGPVGVALASAFPCP